MNPLNHPREKFKKGLSLRAKRRGKNPIIARYEISNGGKEQAVRIPPAAARKKRNGMSLGLAEKCFFMPVCYYHLNA